MGSEDPTRPDPTRPSEDPTRPEPTRPSEDPTRPDTQTTANLVINGGNSNGPDSETSISAGGDFTTGAPTGASTGASTTGDFTTGASTTGGAFTTGAPTGDFTTGKDFTTEGDYTNDWESTTAAYHTTTVPDPTTLPPSQCIDEGCSSEHDGWGECVDFSKDVDWQRLSTEFDLSAGHVPGKCGNARVAVEECCKCMKAKIHHTTTTTQAPTKPWYHYQNWGKK